MEGKFQDHGQLDQDLEEWLSPRRSQPDRGFFSEEDEQEPIQTEGLGLKGEILSNQDLEGEISIMVVIKHSEKVQGSGDNIYLIGIQTRHAPSIQALPSLVVFLGNKIQEYPLSHKRINTVII